MSQAVLLRILLSWDLDPKNITKQWVFMVLSMIYLWFWWVTLDGFLVLLWFVIKFIFWRRGFLKDFNHNISFGNPFFKRYFLEMIIDFTFYGCVWYVCGVTYIICVEILSFKFFTRYAGGWKGTVKGLYCFLRISLCFLC